MHLTLGTNAGRTDDLVYVRDESAPSETPGVSEDFTRQIQVIDQHEIQWAAAHASDGAGIGCRAQEGKRIAQQRHTVTEQWQRTR
jgi:hypothetical protein